MANDKEETGIISAISVIDEDKNTNLHVFAAHDHYEKLKKLEDGLKIDVQNIYGWTPLMVAARHGHLEAVKVLLEKRADATKRSKYDANAFELAVASGNLHVVQYILKHLLVGGVSVKAMEAFVSPLAIAMLFNHARILEFLLTKSFNPCALEMDSDMSPLMYAALNDNPIFFNLLLSKGADPNVCNSNGKTAQDLARNRWGETQRAAAVVQLQRYHQHHEEFAMYPTSPMIFVNSPSCPPPMHLPPTRKSSFVLSPGDISPMLASLSPISPHPQLFFPPNFSLPAYNFFAMPPPVQDPASNLLNMTYGRFIQPQI